MTRATAFIIAAIAFGSPLPQPTEWQHLRNQIDAAMIFARTGFINVL